MSFHQDGASSQQPLLPRCALQGHRLWSLAEGGCCKTAERIQALRICFFHRPRFKVPRFKVPRCHSAVEYSVNLLHGTAD